jgi:hypothetical protein
MEGPAIRRILSAVHGHNPHFTFCCESLQNKWIQAFCSNTSTNSRKVIRGRLTAETPLGENKNRAVIEKSVSR